ncbi:GNAT family N-acetyltransferase [Xanthomonas bonasiae]|uniref:GNAT family N-acetyltransferase n=1 Tax=Xanthomonas bonasiae TaxID=2810351 RepID=UPI001981B47C|nr:GNAT family N-acetyltransferase [Xanthomonas bonasiae]MBN6110896.1 GNAT family N-acetyltransferase [Xanthomonas bonasiae]
MSATAPPSGAVALRAARHADIAAMWALRTRCVRQVCSTHYPSEVIAAWASAPAPATYPQLIASGGAVLAEDAGGRLRGFGLADLAGSEIDGLFVDPDVRGSGLGRRLLQALEAKLVPGARVHLAAALNAVAFYRAQGYAVLQQGSYAHPSGIALACVYMEKHPAQTQAGTPQAAV